jgi:hypothetical protein
MLLTVLVGLCSAAPKPAVVQKAGDWTVNVKFENPQEILLRTGSDNRPARFWYIIITLTNKTNQEAAFYPQCDLMTDTFQIISAGKNVPPAVFERIKTRHQSRYKFLEPFENAGNKILQGEDNTKDIAITWPDFDPKAKNISIFITGLSNESAVVEHPVAKDEQGRPVMVFLRKTLELSYKFRGDSALRSAGDIVFEGQYWVMR